MGLELQLSRRACVSDEHVHQIVEKFEQTFVVFVCAGTKDEQAELFNLS